MAFTIGDVIAKILEGWGLNAEKVLAEAERVKAEFPDLAERVNQFETFLREALAPALDVTRFTGTIRGIALDVMTGLSGADPESWRGSV